MHERHPACFLTTLFLAGVFRPEMLLPMGLPEGVVVIAWGLSLERPTMIKYKYDNIRDLVGPKVRGSLMRIVVCLLLIMMMMMMMMMMLLFCV